MPQFNGDVIFLDGSGQVRATNGSLTLRGDDTGTKSVIIGSGMALRPETDIRIDLGRPDLRWHKTYTGYIESISGILGDNQPAGNKLTFDQNNFEWDGASVQFTSSTVDFINAQLILDSSSQLISNGILDVLGTFRVRTNIDAVDGDVVHRIGSPTSRFGYVYAGSGIFNALRPYTSGTFINVEGSLLPSSDALYSLGTSSARWGTAHVASGIFNTIGASVSGTRIESAASFIPNRHNIYSLGTTAQRWAIIYATSGIIPTVSSTTISAGTITCDTIGATTGQFNDLIIDRTLTLNVDGFIITQVGATSWDLNGAQLDIINGTFGVGANLIASNGVSVSAGLSTDTLDVTSTATITGTLTTRNVVPQTDRLYALGTSALRYSRMHAASGVFNTLSPQSSGTYVTSVGSIVPERDSLYSLGTSVLRWGNLYATSGTINTLLSADITATTSLNALGSFGVLGLAVFNGGTFFGNSAAPSTDPAHSFGLQGFRWAQLYAVSGFIETINPLPSGGFLTVNGSIIPDADLVRGLGSNGAGSRRWATVHAGSGIFTTAATIKGAPVVTNKDAVTTVHAVVTANSGAIINSNAERDIYNYTIPANTLSASGKLNLEIVGSITNMSAGAVNFTPRLYIGGTAIWGDIISITAGPRAADFEFLANVCSLGSVTGQRVRGSIGISSRTAGSITGNGDLSATFTGGTGFSSVATSGTVDFSSPVNIRVTMQPGTNSPLVSYSGFHAIMTHTPFPGA